MNSTIEIQNDEKKKEFIPRKIYISNNDYFALIIGDYEAWTIDIRKGHISFK